MGESFARTCTKSTVTNRLVAASRPIFLFIGMPGLLTRCAAPVLVGAGEARLPVTTFA